MDGDGSIVNKVINMGTFIPGGCIVYRCGGVFTKRASELYKFAQTLNGYNHALRAVRALLDSIWMLDELGGFLRQLEKGI